MKNPIHQKQTITQHNNSFHRSPWRRCILLNLLIFACFALSPTAQAITDAKAEDTHDKYKNVGTFIVIRGPNPIGLPEGIAATVTAVLIHERVLLSAGHFVARAYNNGNGVPFFSRVVVSFSPDNALDPSTWIPVPSAASAWVPHPSFPMPCSPQSCPFNDIDGLPEPGISDIGLTFLDAPAEHRRGDDREPQCQQSAL